MADWLCEASARYGSTSTPAPPVFSWRTGGTGRGRGGSGGTFSGAGRVGCAGAASAGQVTDSPPTSNTCSGLPDTLSSVPQVLQRMRFPYNCETRRSLLPHRGQNLVTGFSVGVSCGTTTECPHAGQCQTLPANSESRKWTRPHFGHERPSGGMAASQRRGGTATAIIVSHGPPRTQPPDSTPDDGLSLVVRLSSRQRIGPGCERERWQGGDNVRAR